MTGVFLILLILIFCNILTVKISGQKFGTCLPVTLMLIPYFLYYSQFIFHRFRWGYAAIVGLAGAGAVLFLIGLIRRDQGFLRNVGSIGLLYFVITFLALVVWDRGRNLSGWDDIAFWGKFVKEMMRTGHFYSEPEALLPMHKDYPPFLSLFELFWCRFTGGFSESGMITAHHVFVQSIFMPALIEMLRIPGHGAAAVAGAIRTAGRVRPAASGNTPAVQESAQAGSGTAPAMSGTGPSHAGRDRVRRFFRDLCFCVVLNLCFNFIILMFFGERIYMVQRDIAMAILLAYGIMLITNLSAIRNRFQYFSFALLCPVMIQTKQIGSAFVILLLFYYSLVYLFQRRCVLSPSDAGYGQAVKKASGKSLIGRWLARIAGIAVITLIPVVIWKRYIRSLGIVGQFNLSDLTLGAILEVVKNPELTLQRSTAVSYFKALFGKDIGESIFPMPYLVITIFLFLMVLVLYRRRTRMMDRVRGVSLAVTFAVGAVGYALALGILYLFFFTSRSMKTLSSYERYMATYAAAEALVLFFIVMMNLFETRRVSLVRLAAAATAFLAVTGGNNASVFVPGCLMYDSDEVQAAKQAAGVIEQYAEPYSLVYVLTDNQGNGQYYTFEYCWDTEIIKDWTDRQNMDYSVAENKEDTQTEILSGDYFYVMALSDNFNKTFKFLNGGHDFEVGQLYRVEDGKLVLCE